MRIVLSGARNREPPSVEPECIACGDTGKNSHGGECVPCRLNGRLKTHAVDSRGQLQLF